jgi:tetratricopeptide (TPR) repeat protein
MFNVRIEGLSWVDVIFKVAITQWRKVIQGLICLGLMVGISIVPVPSAIAASGENTSNVQAEVNALFDQAFKATGQGNFEAAETYWSDILDRYPRNAAVWSNRGNARVSQHKLQEAIEDYNQSIALAPDQPDPYLNRGTALEGLQDWQGAIADYNRVLELDPQDTAAYNNRGNAQAGLGNWDKALDDYQKATQLNPGFAMARANAALALYQMGQTEEAIHQFRTLLRRYPQFADIRAALTAALWANGQHGEAESQWVSAIGLDSRYRDLDWVKTIRRWPPQLVNALGQFLSLTSQNKMS